METEKKQATRLFLQSIQFTFLWGLIAHGYRYFNLFFSHDSLAICQNKTEFQLSIGRFMHPVFSLFRGNIYAPALIGFLSLLFIGIAVYLVCRLLQTDDTLSVVLYSGIMTTNVTVSLLNATYINDVDLYTFALLLSVLCVYVCRKMKRPLLAAVLCALSLGLYQAFLQVAVFLFMMLALLDLLQKKETKQIVADGVRAICALLAGMILYGVILYIVSKASTIGLANEYNGVTEVGKYGTVRALLYQVYQTYYNVLYYFAVPSTFRIGIVRIVNIAFLAATSCFLVLIIVRKKIRGTGLLLLIVLILLMPFGMNIVCFISQGMEHELMIYSFFLTYVLAYEIFKLWAEAFADELSRCRLCSAENLRCRVFPLAFAIILFCNIVFSNQIYLKKHLEYQSTMEMLNRVIYKMEDTDGYEPGETPVALVGAFQSSPLAVSREGFPTNGVGLEAGISITYVETYQWFFEYVMNYPINLLDVDALFAVSESDEVMEMPNFPAKDSCKMIDGVMVVKISEDKPDL